jgi:glycosyltransferase involved in cell wall biosynthesis
MKIVHVIPALARGGAEGVVIDLANQAAKRGHDVAILCAVPTRPELHSRPVRPEVKLHYILRLKLSQRAANALMPIWLLRNHRWLLSRDLVHCHLTAGSLFGALLKGLLRISNRRRPLVVETYHAVGMAISSRERALHAALLTGRDGVAFMAEDSYWSEFRRARPNRLFRTIPNGVAPLPSANAIDVDRFRRVRTRIPDGAIVVGSVGRLVPARRPELLVEAFAQLVAAIDKPVHLLLAGEGPEHHALEAEARRLGIASRVHLPGLVLNPEQPLGLMDLYLTVNVRSVSGVAALEAIFAGVPVIALQLVEDYGDAPSDWIPSYVDPRSLAQRATELIARPGALKELAATQLAFAEAHRGIESMARAYDEFYQAALAASPSTAAAKE